MSTTQHSPYHPLGCKIMQQNIRVFHELFGYGLATHVFSNDEVHIVFDNHVYKQKDSRARHHRILLNRLTIIQQND